MNSKPFISFDEEQVLYQVWFGGKLIGHLDGLQIKEAPKEDGVEVEISQKFYPVK